MREDLAQWLASAVRDGELDLPLPGSGQTDRRLLALAAPGRRSPVLARLGEGHADAIAILNELGEAPGRVRDQRWGVWAAVPKSVTAEHVDGGWRLTGDRPWCSGAGFCTHALVTAAAPDGIRLFAVELGDNAAQAIEGTWPAVGMIGSDSRTVRFSGSSARPVGQPGQYVQRPGFWHGGIGVAACWYGGAAGVADQLLSAVRAKDLGPHADAHLGAVDVLLSSARTVLLDAARQIDAAPGQHAELLALRVRAAVETAATEVLDHVGRALGAGPLCHDADHAARVADLTVYLRQSHAEADLAHLGGIVKKEDPGW